VNSLIAYLEGAIRVAEMMPVYDDDDNGPHIRINPEWFRRLRYYIDVNCGTQESDLQGGAE